MLNKVEALKGLEALPKRELVKALHLITARLTNVFAQERIRGWECEGLRSQVHFLQGKVSMLTPTAPKAVVIQRTPLETIITQALFPTPPEVVHTVEVPEPVQVKLCFLERVCAFFKRFCS